MYMPEEVRTAVIFPNVIIVGMTGFALSNVTDPKDITYGKSDVCYELIRTMQLVGINVITRTEVEECFAVIDDEIVWHGGMNLLGKADVWDNLMRIRNSQVETELLEIALGCSEERRKSE